MPISLKYPIQPSFVQNGIGYNTCGNLRRPLPFTGEVGLNPNIQFQSYAPYVEARFYGINDFVGKNLENAIAANRLLYYVSTGNFLGGGESRSAFIKSFTMGTSQSLGATLEIVDASGDDFVGFYNKIYGASCDALPKSFDPAAPLAPDFARYIVSINVGYVFTNTEGVKVLYVAPNAIGLPDKKIGPYINFTLVKVEVSYENNISKYKLTLKGPDLGLAQAKVNNRFGAPGVQIPLIRAAELMIDGECPPKALGAALPDARVILVKPPQGATGEWSYTGEVGTNPSDPSASKKGVFAGYNLPPLDAIRKNLDTFVTRDGNGVYMCFPSGANDDTLYLIEAESSFCDAEKGIKKSCAGVANFLGTYVVNGGDLSPVIKFTPKIEFFGMPNRVQGGAAGGAMAAKAAVVNNGCPPTVAGGPIDKNKIPGQDVAIKGAIPQDKMNGVVHPRDLPQKQADAAQANMSAQVASKPNMGVITAELEIQGDPRFLFSLNWQGGSIKIIFVNPFAIGYENFVAASPQLEWLAKPPINDKISSGLYFINSCDHEVSEGKWITKLKLTQTMI